MNDSLRTYEVNFDGLVGPTHNYSGLSVGNLASMAHAGKAANPQAAALQGLAKMRWLMNKGIVQAVFLPPMRPDISFLRNLGCSGDIMAMVKQVVQQPLLLANSMSASAMWAANAATVSPSADTADARVHITPANLANTLHRSIECRQTTRQLRTIFSNEDYFHIHNPLPSHHFMGDEGAANHSRLCASHHAQGIELFVYNRQGFSHKSSIYPHRQAREACVAIVNSHQLDPKKTVLVEQNSIAVEKGAFHNDVVCVANENVLLLHEKAFSETAIHQIQSSCNNIDIQCLIINEAELPLAQAIQSYLFNSQLITLPNNEMLLLLPQEAKINSYAYHCVQRLIADDNPIKYAHFVDLNESMKNGGGPACLRLRVVLNSVQIKALCGSVVLTDNTIDQLESLVKRYYRTCLLPSDLADPEFIQDSLTVLDKFTQCLSLGNLYDFQH